MKGGNIVALQALRNIFEQNAEIFNIDFLFVSDEETGSDDSKKSQNQLQITMIIVLFLKQQVKNMKF
jgi:glutamate carboxypeptidase